MRILVVDDSNINREVAGRIFSGEGALIYNANNGREAVEWLQGHPGQVDVVLMDVQMPVMDGYETTRLLRGMPEFKDLPVVALTAGAFKKEQDAAKAAGMTGFLAKPFDVDAAIRLLQQVTGWQPPPGAAEPAPMAASVTTISRLHKLPGLNVGKGLAIWKDATIYRQYLNTFSDKHGNCVSDMGQLDRNAAAALAHKLKGAAANLAIEDVARHAGEVEQAFLTAAPAGPALDKLRIAMDIAKISIARYAPPEIHAGAVGATDAVDTDRVSALLAKTLIALAADNPAPVEPLLTQLGELLPSETLRPLVQAVENFDFRAAEAVTKELAAAFGLPREP